jgi:hypothetical protein
MTLIPIAFFWLLILAGIRRGSSIDLHLMFATMSLGCFAVVPTELSAGMTLTGPPVIASFMLMKSFLRKNSIRAYLAAAFDIRKLGLLFAFLVVAGTVTFFAPRFFLNDVDVIPMKLKTVGMMGADRLQPTKQNISQLLYVAISVSAVFMFSRMLDTAKKREQAINAFQFGAGVAVVTGWLDFASSFIPITPLLDLFRTGSYSLMTDNYVGGYKRVVGLMPEASAFGAICLFFLCFLYFSRFSSDGKTGRSSLMYKQFLAVNLSFLLVASMSSSAYLGLAVFVTVATLEWFYRNFFLPKSSILRQGLKWEMMACLSVVGIATLTLVALTEVREELFVRLDRLIFSKSDSLSYEERSMWNEVSLNCLFQTSGIGCGLGGSRASNRVVSVFSNAGVLGGLLFYGFLVQCLFRRAGAIASNINVMHAIRWSFLPIFTLEFLVGTTPDMGLSNAWMFGMASAVGLEPFNRALSHEAVHTAQPQSELSRQNTNTIDTFGLSTSNPS